MRNLDTYLSEGFYKNVKSDLISILNTHVYKPINERIWFEENRGKVYLCEEIHRVGSLGVFRNIKVEVDRKDIDAIYRIVTEHDTDRVIYITLEVYGIPNKEHVRVLSYIRCYETEHDIFWGGKIINRTFKVDRVIDSSCFELTEDLDEGFYANTHSRIVDQLNDKIWKAYCMNKDGQENYYFTLDHGILELHIRKLDYSAFIDYEDIEISLYDTERDEIFRLLQECNKFRWRVVYQMLAKDKYRIMLKVYDGDTYIYHVSFNVPPQKMAVYRVDKKQLSLADFIK